MILLQGCLALREAVVGLLKAVGGGLKGVVFRHGGKSDQLIRKSPKLNYLKEN